MKRFLKTYSIALLFIYLAVLSALCSSALTAVFVFSPAVQQTLSTCLYVPFMVMIGGKLLSDVCCFHLSGFNIVYYLFGVYYILLTAYRFFVGAEAIESFYYAVVFFGVLGMYALITEQKLGMDWETLRKNLMIVATFFVVLKVIFTFIEGRVILNLPINNLYTTSLLVILIPFLMDTLQHEQTKRAKLSGVLLSLTVTLVLVCSSRAIVMLGAAVFAVVFLVYVTNLSVVKKVLAGVCAALMLVVAFSALNVGVVRRSLVREFGGLATLLSSKDTEDAESSAPEEEEPSDPEAEEPSDPATDSDVTPENDSTAEQPDSEAKPSSPGSSTVADQIDRSDAMRAELMAAGRAEVRKNPIFGTGDLYYTYDLGYKTMEQTAHNFIIESIICYGLVGTAMIALLLLCILKQCGIFRKESFKQWRVWVYIPAVLVYYLAFGMVQPSVYNTLVCPIFAVAVAYYGDLLYPAQDRVPAKQIRLLMRRKGL